ncbi:hypothetical protein NG891_00530 [Enterococcus gallinarum]|uniref:hypothetical protein n=1 Tax=Enterococcus gallinarum TaxID=1353 RepID=UPI002091097B|nr:hypothetical protein [Enterococcus gallinarum]MCO5475203.1 hypothetical protein [Enterococcus gallinarum]
MARAISRKAHLHLYKTSDSSTKEIYDKLIRNDIINAFNFLMFRNLVQGSEREIVNKVIDSQNFESKLDLHIRLHEAAQAIIRLEKHFDKLAEHGCG